MTRSSLPYAWTNFTASMVRSVLEYNALSASRDAVAWPWMRRVNLPMAIYRNGQTTRATSANCQSIVTITQNIAISVMPELSKGMTPFMTIDWMANVSDITRNNKSPVCCW